MSNYATKTGRAPAGDAGFSLIELALVLIMIGLMSAIMMPNIAVARFQLDASVMEVGTGLQASQRLAVLRQHDLVISFDTTTGRMTVHSDANNDGAFQSGEDVRVVDLEEGVMFGLGGASGRPQGNTAVTFTNLHLGLPALTFHRNGSASQEGIIYLTSIRSGSGGAYPEDTRAVEVERSTGRVRCFSFKTNSWTEAC